MFDDWIDVLLSGSLEIKLPQIAATSGSTPPMQGSGTISWDADSGIRIQAVTDGARGLDSLFSGVVPMPGTLIPHSEYLTFSGQTQHGWDVSTCPTNRDGIHLNSASPEVVWDLQTHGLTLEHKTSDEAKRRIRILMGPLPQGGWTRFSDIEDNNPFFGGKSGSRDWLYSRGEFGEVAARRRSDEWFEVVVLPADDKALGEAHVIITAVARAFGFILGRRSAIRGHEEINGGKTTRVLDTRQRVSTTNTILPPLGWQSTYMGNVEPLLGPTIDFFLTELGEKVASYLYVCWDAADNAHATQLAISSICVEGLLKLAAKMMGPAEPDDCDADLAALGAWIATKPAGFSPQFLARLVGMRPTFSSLSPKDIFRDWIRRGVLGVTVDDMKAWSETRNPSAHGKLSTTVDSQPKLQDRVTRHARVQSVLNRIILKLIGYTGEYIDYSRPGHFPAVFPSEPVPPSEGVTP